MKKEVLFKEVISNGLFSFYLDGSEDAHPWTLSTFKLDNEHLHLVHPLGSVLDYRVIGNYDKVFVED